MSQANQLTGTGRVVALTRGIVWCVLVIAVLAGVTTLAIGVTNLIDGHTAMALTVAQKLPPAADAGSATVVSGNYETAYVVLSKLSGGAVALATIATVTALLIQAVIASTIALMAWRMLRRRPFQRSLTWTVALAGAGLLLVGLAFEYGEKLQRDTDGLV